MRKLTIALAVAALSSIRPAGAATSDDPFKNTDCTKATVQIEMDYCANKELEAQDKKLNVLYRTLVTKYDTQSRAFLKVAEKNWIAYRDSECNFETALSLGGTEHPMDFSYCEAEKTKLRIKELEAQRDCPESEASCNQPPK